MEQQGEFYILHFNDVYDIEEQVREPKGGAARFLATLRLIRSTLNNVLTLFSGDLFSPSSLSNIYQGQQMVYPIQQFEVDVACLGNHDFDFPLPIVKQLMAQSNTPWLLSNVHNTETGQLLADALPHFIKSINGIKVGFFALAEEEWLGQISEIPSHLISYEDYVHCAERLIKYLREEQQCDFVIALTHMRIPNDQHLIRSFPPGSIDLVLGGHDHIWYREKINQTVFAKSGTNFRNLGAIRVAINRSEPSDWVQQLQGTFDKYSVVMPELICYHLHNPISRNSIIIEILPLDLIEAYPKDTIMDQYVLDKVNKYNLETLKNIAYTGVELETRFNRVRVQETNVANLFSDILRYEYSTDVAFINTGTLRSDELMRSGPITYQTIDKIFAIPDVIVCYRATGQVILQTLENAVSKVPALDGRFLGVSGLTFKYNPKKPPMERIQLADVTIQGQPLDLERTYKVATKSFIADGFDGFTTVQQGDYILDKAAGIPIKSIFLQFFETIRKHPLIRKMSQDMPTDEEPQFIRIKDFNLHPEKPEDETLLDKRYKRFSPIISDIIVEDQEPYLILNPVVEGRIIVIS